MRTTPPGPPRPLEINYYTSSKHINDYLIEYIKAIISIYFKYISTNISFKSPK